MLVLSLVTGVLIRTADATAQATPTARPPERTPQSIAPPLLEPDLAATRMLHRGRRLTVGGGLMIGASVLGLVALASVGPPGDRCDGAESWCISFDGATYGLGIGLSIPLLVFGVVLAVHGSAVQRHALERLNLDVQVERTGASFLWTHRFG